MTFVTAGLAIAGLLAVSIPILIHLLARQRRKPVEWAAMRFLIEAFRKHRRRLQLEQIILLAVRCLIVALLGLALARPILEATGLIAAGGSRAVFLVIDDGMVSGVTGDDGRTALQRHVRQAADLVRSLGPGDAVGLITAARPAKALLSPPSTDRAAVIELLESLASKESPTDLAGAFGLVKGAADESRKTQQQTLVYLFSEFRGGSAPLDAPLPATQVDAEGAVKLFASPAADQAVSNIQIVSIDPVRSLLLPGATDGTGQVTVRLARSGGAASVGDVSTVRLSGEGLPAIAPRNVQWQPGQTHADVKFAVNLGGSSDRALGLTASIDDDALNADNQRHVSLELRNQIRVLLIDRRSFGFERTLDQLSAGQWIRRALEPRDKSPIQIVEVEPAALDLADVRTADVAMLPRPDLLTDAGWKVLREFVNRDGLLIITPPAEVNVHQWTEHLSKDLQLPWRLALEVQQYPEGLAMGEEQPAAELLRLVSSEMDDLVRPVLAMRVLAVDRNQTQASPLLTFADGSPMAIAGSPEEIAPGESAASNGSAPDRAASQQRTAARGLVVYLAVAPELAWTNLPSKPLMVPLFHEMVRQGLSVIRASQQLQVGEQPALASMAAAREVVEPGGRRIALDRAGRTQQPLDKAGVYTVMDQSNHPIGQLAVNVDPVAGETNVQSAAAVESWLQTSGPWTTFDASNIAASLSVDRATSPIAGFLLLAVLALAILETLLARWFSHAYQANVALSRFGDVAGPRKSSAAVAETVA